MMELKACAKVAEMPSFRDHSMLLAILGGVGRVRIDAADLEKISPGRETSPLRPLRRTRGRGRHVR